MMLSPKWRGWQENTQMALVDLGILQSANQYKCDLMEMTVFSGK